MRCACGKPSTYSVMTVPGAEVPLINPCQDHIAKILDDVSKVHGTLFIVRVD